MNDGPKAWPGNRLTIDCPATTTVVRVILYLAKRKKPSKRPDKVVIAIPMIIEFAMMD